MERLRELRREKGLTTTALASIIGCSNQTITKNESGNREPDFPTLCKLADYFNVTVDYLLGHTNERTSQLRIPDEYKDLPIAFYEGAKDLTQEDIDAVIKFMEFLKAQNKSK